ncbi:SNF1-related protein kinase regulatory subunit beta-2 [Sesamum angolense]|uniref:SNF1-related protein kinase regulatory subunit beta-2 n=1 Tax=Sesamum angolense TaxID=2727404 RepID=A0AAE1W4Q8_9LAMI|nr:SNF1-related protein kinase regulatory subunit beta-2 [Sesamum angolense]
MGNANGREEGGSGSPSGVEEGGGGQVSMIDRDGGAGNYVADGGEYMGQSSLPSPRASQSPLMFRPQMPMAPLKDLVNCTSPILHGCRLAQVMKTHIMSKEALQRSGKDFTIMKVLPSGVYQYRFIIDGQWRTTSQKISTAFLGSNHLSPRFQLQQLATQSRGFAKEPPLVPPHLNLTLLNAPSSHMEIPPPHSRPQHVVLNHLYMHRDRSGQSAVALGSTNRFLSKYVTVVLYKSIQR